MDTFFVKSKHFLIKICTFLFYLSWNHSSISHRSCSDQPLVPIVRDTIHLQRTLHTQPSQRIIQLFCWQSYHYIDVHLWFEAQLILQYKVAAFYSFWLICSSKCYELRMWWLFLLIKHFLFNIHKCAIHSLSLFVTKLIALYFVTSKIWKLKMFTPF